MVRLFYLLLSASTFNINVTKTVKNSYTSAFVKTWKFVSFVKGMTLGWGIQGGKSWDFTTKTFSVNTKT